MGVLTMSNIPNRSDRFIVHIAVTYLYSLLFYCYIVWAFKGYTSLRSAYLAANCVRGFTLLLRNIPSDLLGKKVLRRWFEARLSATVVAVNFVYEAGRLDSLKKLRSKLLVKLEKAEMQGQVYTRRGLLEVFGEKVLRAGQRGMSTPVLISWGDRSKRLASTRNRSNGSIRRSRIYSKQRAGLSSDSSACCKRVCF
jgi:hypothetical protein